MGNATYVLEVFGRWFQPSERLLLLHEKFSFNQKLMFGRDTPLNLMFHDSYLMMSLRKI